jgi:TonB-linked SusC/RagA family outer membrane protein
MNIILKYEYMKNKMLILLMGVFLFTHHMDAQNLTIKGTVTEENGEPLIGVMIVVDGTTIGTVTDFDGKYILDDVDPNQKLKFTYLGFANKIEAIAGRSVINVTMTSESEKLDEVVVVGFGTQKKVNLTGSVSSVSRDVLENKPVASIGQALQGVVPNLNITTNGGGPNEVPKFNVRGGTSVTMNDKNKWVIANGSPLILVDGIEMGADYLNMMNPEDIENVAVLKDAAASAIYGARAAYGVMLVTTKSGQKNQKTKVGYSLNLQWNTPSHIPDVLDSYTHHLAGQQATLMTQGTVSPWSNTVLAAKKKYIDNPTPENAWIYNEGSTTDFTWVGNGNPYEQAVRDWTPTQKHSVNISGGSEKTRYYASIGYQLQEGMYKINTDKRRRYNGLISLDTEITKWFTLGTKVSYNVATYDEPYLNVQKGTLWEAMQGQVEKNMHSPIKTGPNDPIPNAWTDNVVGWLAYGATQAKTNTAAIFNLNPTLIVSKDLKLKGEFAYRPTDYSLNKVIPTRDYVVTNWESTIQTHTNPSSVFQQITHSDLFTINAYADYNKTFAEKHAFSGVLGFNQEWYKYRRTEATGQNLLTSEVPVIGLTTGNQYAADALEHWAVRGAFLRLNYNYMSRYLVEFNGRYDGTSRFPTDTRYKFFPSFSAGWRISEEAFMKDTRTWLDNLKLRASWGSLGNQNVDNYAYISKYGKASYVGYIMDDSRPMGITAPGLIAPNLTWETATTIDFGLDFSLLDNRLDFVGDWYSRETTDILVTGDKYPAILGTSAPKKNSGILKTNGWEIALKWRDNLANGVRYDVGFVLSDYITTVKEFNGNPSKLLSSLYSGMKMGEIWGYETVGILQESDFTIDENGKYILNGADQTKLSSNWYPGDIRYADIGGKVDENGNSIGSDGEISSGNGTVANPGDRKIIGNSTPRFNFGLTGNVSWKNFDLNIFFQGVAKRDIFIANNAFWGAGGAGNYDTYQNSWTPERTDAKYPMYASRGQNRHAQTGYLFNAAYLRLKSLTVGYTIPKRITDKMKMDRIRLNLSGYNLFEITKVPDAFDPETISSSYPMLRSVSFGLQVGF